MKNELEYKKFLRIFHSIAFIPISFLSVYLFLRIDYSNVVIAKDQINKIISNWESKYLINFEVNFAIPKCNYTILKPNNNVTLYLCTEKSSINYFDLLKNHERCFDTQNNLIFENCIYDEKNIPLFEYIYENVTKNGKIDIKLKTEKPTIGLQITQDNKLNDSVEIGDLIYSSGNITRNYEILSTNYIEIEKKCQASVRSSKIQFIYSILNLITAYHSHEDTLSFIIYFLVGMSVFTLASKIFILTDDKKFSRNRSKRLIVYFLFQILVSILLIITMARFLIENLMIRSYFECHQIKLKEKSFTLFLNTIEKNVLYSAFILCNAIFSVMIVFYDLKNLILLFFKQDSILLSENRNSIH